LRLWIDALLIHPFIETLFRRGMTILGEG